MKLLAVMGVFLVSKLIVMSPAVVCSTALYCFFESICIVGFSIFGVFEIGVDELSLVGDFATGGVSTETGLKTTKTIATIITITAIGKLYCFTLSTKTSIQITSSQCQNLLDGTKMRPAHLPVGSVENPSIFFCASQGPFPVFRLQAVYQFVDWNNE